MLTENSIREAYAYLLEFNEKIGGNKIGAILEVNLLWQLGRKEEPLAKFAECVEKDINKAKEIFEINPSLTSVQEFVHLTQ
jgi:hypothetical protein